MTRTVFRWMSGTPVLLLGVIGYTSRATAACPALPYSIANGQVADASQVMSDLNSLKTCAEAAVVPSGSPTTGSLAKFAGPNAVATGNLTGDVTTSGGLTTTLATSGVVAGTYVNATFVVDTKGRLTNAVNGSSSGGSVWWFAPPAASSFTVSMMDNLTMKMVDDPSVGLIMTTTPNNSISGIDSGQYMGKAIANPNTDWEIRTRIEISGRPTGDYTRWGVALSNATKNKRVDFGWDSRSVVYWGYFNNPSGWGQTEQQTSWTGGYPRWIKISHSSSGATITFFASQDGKVWTKIRAMNDTDWLGEVPKFVGVGFDTPPSGVDFDLGLSISYWYQSW